MTDLDQAIRDALSIEDAKALEGLGADQTLFRHLGSMFTGKLAWVNAIIWVFGFAMFAGFVYCAWRFFEAVEVREMILWSSGAAVAFVALAVVKVWGFLEINKHSLLLEIKRLELQVALARRGG